MKVLESFRLDGKVALVTGGAGLYGRQITEALAEAGAKTFIASRNIEALKAKADIFKDAGLDVTPLQFDQGDEESIRSLLKEIIRLAGGVDVLINNAVMRASEVSAGAFEQFARSMTVNATGLFMMTEIFGSHMAGMGGGSIVNIGSIHGMVGPDFTLYEGTDMIPPPDYFFHKGGMLQLTRFAASKFGPSGVRVNTVCPGGFFSNQKPRFVERYNARTFLGRMAGEEDLKGVIVFLASDASVYVTGANIPVDGGYTAK